MAAKKMLKKIAPGIENMLLDEAVPVEQRKHLLAQLCMAGDEKSTEIVETLLGAAASTKAETIYHTKTRELAEKIEEMMKGPLRAAIFLSLLPKGPLPRARVLLEDGTSAFVPVPDEDLAISLRCGETVLLEAQGNALLARDAEALPLGEEARLERRLDDGRVEVTVHDHERRLLHTSATLAGKLDTREVCPGSYLVVCLRRMIAFDALPVEDGLSHFRFLARQPVPAVFLGRDVARPHPFIEELVEKVRLEMTQPELPRSFGLHRCSMKLLSGVSGTGKTFSILALWRRIYEVMSEVTGASIEELPPRVMRLRQAEVLSKWLGDSDKNLDRFFDEVERLASEKFLGADGRAHDLPVLVIIEEVDGLAATRGDEPVYDRILTTVLQRLDTSRPELRNKLVLFIATTNMAHRLDHAFVRRIGGTVVPFGRLGRTDFVAVLDKHLQDRPVRVNGSVVGVGSDARRQLIAETASWLFAPREAVQGEVELMFAGSTTPVTKHGRDFLTASLVEQAVQGAASSACRAAAAGNGSSGLTRESMVQAIQEQIRSVVDVLNESNVREYLDLPDGVRVASLNRLRHPAVQPVQLERAI